MEASPIDIVIFAPLAPILGVLLFWFLQLLFIESQKFLLSKIRPKHEALCRFTNFLGILFQSICHALGYTVTKSGISEFVIKVNYGKVSPKKDKKGIFEWISNAFLFIGPFFIPAALLLICLFFLIPQGFNIASASNVMAVKYTFGGQMINFGTTLYTFSQSFLGFLFNIDLLHPGHLGFLLLLIILGMGIRPTHIGEQKVDKVDMIYDLRNIWALIRHNPLYILLLFLMAYLFYYISLLFNTNWYVALFSVFGMISIISIIALIITHFIIILIKTTDEIPGRIKIIPYLVLPLSYIAGRSLFLYVRTDIDLTLSLSIMIVCTVLVTYLLLRKKSDKFKTLRKIKLLKKKDKGEKENE